MEPFAEMIRRLLVTKHSGIVDEVGVQAGETDFQSHLLRMKTKQPEAAVIFLWDERSLLSLLQHIRVHLPDVMLATVHDGAGWLQNPVFKPVLPWLLHAEFVMSDSSFAGRFEERFGYRPILTASNADDALNAVLHAFEPGATSGEEVPAHLMNSEFETVTFGRFRFAPDGSVPS